MYCIRSCVVFSVSCMRGCVRAPLPHHPPDPRPGLAANPTAPGGRSRDGRRVSPQGCMHGWCVTDTVDAIYRGDSTACALRLTLRDKPPNLGTAAIKLYLGLTSSDHHTRWQPHSPRDPRTASLGYVWASQQPRPPRLRVPYLWLLGLKSWFSTPQKSARTTNGKGLYRGRHPPDLRTC